MEIFRPKAEGILIVDYGSQYTLLIARRFRELGVYAEVVGSGDAPPENFKVHGVVLSGGPDSVSETGSRTASPWIFDLQVPLLGICYGMQLLANHYGGKVRSGTEREYGSATIRFEANLDASEYGKLFFAEVPEQSKVWMSHGDDIEEVSEHFATVAVTGDGVTAAIVHRSSPCFGLQFHPEVKHSEHGPKILENFAVGICKAPRNWLTHSMVESIVETVKASVGDGHVLVACSGGVDSSVAAAVLTKALGADKVTGIFVDNGLLRKNEVEWVSTELQNLGIHLNVIDAKQKFYENLHGLSDPEKKRKSIGLTFIEVFEKFAREHKNEFSHLGQGTLYPDVIESAGHGSGAKVIKSHHNVGGLPEELELELVEPFRYLFKDEVRKIGRELGLSPALIDRHPFPGPGLGVRIPGEISAEKVKILQEADDIFIRMLREEGHYHSVWQAFAVLLPVKSVGVMGDNRTYQWALSLRAVEATDGMTAGVSSLPLDFLTRVSDQIVRKVDGINRVLYDITSKPPGTIEWE